MVTHEVRTQSYLWHLLSSNNNTRLWRDAFELFHSTSDKLYDLGITEFGIEMMYESYRQDGTIDPTCRTSRNVPIGIKLTFDDPDEAFLYKMAFL